MTDRGGRLVGMGCMRLSTAPDRDEDRAVAVLHAAFDAGVDLLDTADAYGRDQADVGHNERLIARAIASWKGDRSRLRVATKGGLTRPDGAWVADGRARHLRAACAASGSALGMERLFLYQLHAPDPRTPLERSVRALSALKREGLVEEVGLSNVTVAQIQAARRLVELASVQVELNPWHPDNVTNGVAGYCVESGLLLLAHRPLGGTERRARLLADPVLAAVASRHGRTPFEVVLAWLRSFSPLLVPLPGPTRIETARSAGLSGGLELPAADLEALDRHFPQVAALRTPRRERRPRAEGKGEVVLIVGLPGAGKTRLAGELVAKGYARLNRDEAGGRLADLLPALDRLIESGRTRVVLDNTYTSRKSRGAVVERAFAHGLPVRCVWLETGIEDAQVNAATRMVARYGRLLEPEEMRQSAPSDPGAFGPNVQFRYDRELEPPSLDEGFSRVDRVPFARRAEPERGGRALVVGCEGALWESGPDRPLPWSREGAILPGRAEALRRHHEAGFVIVGLSWRPEIEAGALTAKEVEAGWARLRERLDVPIDFLHCPHGGGPPRCWCRRPLPGLGVLAVFRHFLDPGLCLYVGQGPSDRTFARRLGFAYREAHEFFADPTGADESG